MGVAAVGAALAGASAFAADPAVSFSFSGNYVAQSCLISGPRDHLIDMPAISTSALTSAGSTAGSTPFTLRVQCDSGVTAVGVAFRGPWTVDGRLAVPTGAGYARNVQVQLLNMNGSPITVGDSSTVTTVPITSTEPTPISFIAQYYATGATQAGRVLTAVIYAIELR